jgi:hypothetical protein
MARYGVSVVAQHRTPQSPPAHIRIAGKEVFAGAQEVANTAPT